MSKYSESKRIIPLLGVFPLLLILASVIVFTQNCTDNEEESGNIAIESIQGEWKISHLESGDSLDFSSKPGYAILKKKSGEIIRDYVLINDGVGLRIQEVTSTQPDGYFLWSDRKGNSWTGIWQEDLTRLILYKGVGSRESDEF